MSKRNYRTDAVIAAGIFVLLLLLWRLMTRSEQLGAAGSWLKTNVFGAAGANLAGALGSGAAQSGPGYGTSTVTNESAPPFGGTPDLVTPTSQVVSSSSSSVVRSSSTNDAKIIGGLPDIPVDEATTLAQRLAAAGAKSGDIQFSLSWGNNNDLDLHCIDPKGEHIWYNHKESAQTGGRLDVDQNAQSPYTNAPVENIYWPIGGAPGGVYQLFVAHYAVHGGRDPTAYTVRVIVKDKTNFFKNSLSYATQRTNRVCSIQYDPSQTDPTLRSRFLTPPTR